MCFSQADLANDLPNRLTYLPSHLEQRSITPVHNDSLPELKWPLILGVQAKTSFTATPFPSSVA